MNIARNDSLTCSSVNPSNLPLKSCNTSTTGRILPSISYKEIPISLILALASSVVPLNDINTFLKCVPPSPPLYPTLANIPSNVFNSVVPPTNWVADPPHIL